MESKGKSRMIISERQQDANRQNAQHSTGPKTPGGKTAMRLNALKYGLRARSLLIPGENPEDYKQLWADLEAEWQPQTRTERMHLEQAAVSQWLLARVAESESRLYQEDIPAERQFVLLGYASTQRARLESSFRHAMHDLQQLQKERRAQPQRPQPKQPVQPTPSPVPHNGYPMSEGAEEHPVFCSPLTPDTR